MFNQFDHIPDGLLTATTQELYELLERPTLIHLNGATEQPLFISTLLHGNETTGFYAVQELLKRYADRELPRSLSIFLGNVEAAAEGKRKLASQADYNRIWPGTAHSRSDETDIMEAVTNIMRTKKPFASIDIHNNTGKNPHYACVNVLSAHSLQIAARYSGTMVYFTNPKGVQSSAFAEFCPAVVLECGQSKDQDSVPHALGYVDDILNMEHIPGDHPQGTHLYHTVARVKVPERFSVGSSDTSDIVIDSRHEDMNFQQLDKGSRFVALNDDSAWLDVNNESNEQVAEDYFSREKGELLLRKDVILSMFTSDETAIKQDCLCYFMERLQLNP